MAYCSSLMTAVVYKWQVYEKLSYAVFYDYTNKQDDLDKIRTAHIRKGIAS